MKRHKLLWGLIAACLLLQTVVANLTWRSRLSSPPPTSAPGQAAASPPPKGGPPRGGGQMRVQGRLAEAAATLRAQYEQTRNPQAWRQLLEVIEDTGQPAQLVTEARAFKAAWPADPHGSWMLARGLLFQAATAPADPSVPAWIEEAEKLTGSLEAAHFRTRHTPGATAVLRAQIALLKHQLDDADREAKRALLEGVNYGESASLMIMRVDLNIRAGRLREAEALTEAVGAWMDRDRGAYYTLRPVRYDVMIVRGAYFGKPFTVAELDRVEALQDRLARQGFADPVDSRTRISSKQALQVLREWLVLEERKDLAGQVALLERMLALQPGPGQEETSPRCFYERAVIPHLTWKAVSILAGDLCRKLGRTQQARSHYEAALRIHPDDRVSQQRLRDLDVAGGG